MKFSAGIKCKYLDIKQLPGFIKYYLIISARGFIIYAADLIKNKY